MLVLVPMGVFVGVLLLTFVLVLVRVHMFVLVLVLAGSLAGRVLVPVFLQQRFFVFLMLVLVVRLFVMHRYHIL